MKHQKSASLTNMFFSEMLRKLTQKTVPFVFMNILKENIHFLALSRHWVAVGGWKLVYRRFQGSTTITSD